MRLVSRRVRKTSSLLYLALDPCIERASQRPIRPRLWLVGRAVYILFGPRETKHGKERWLSRETRQDQYHFLVKLTLTRETRRPSPSCLRRLLVWWKNGEHSTRIVCCCFWVFFNWRRVAQSTAQEHLKDFRHENKLYYKLILIRGLAQRGVLIGDLPCSILYKLWVNSKLISECVLENGVQVQLCILWTSFFELRTGKLAFWLASCVLAIKARDINFRWNAMFQFKNNSRDRFDYAFLIARRKRMCNQD